MTGRRSARRAGAPPWAAGLRRRIAWTRAALAWERLWYAAWPLLGVAGLFLALSLLGLWPALPRWVHVGLAAAFGLAGLAAVADAARRFRAPGREEAERRLERENGLAHQPLGALADRPATAPGDPAADTLWRAHQARAVRAVRGLRPVWPRPGVIRRDPWALRHAVVLLIVVGAVIGGTDLAARLAQGFHLPQPAPSGVPAEIQAWIQPPAYTGAPPRFLTARQADGSLIAPGNASGVVWVPTGSVLSVRMGGDRGTPKLEVRSGREARTLRFDQPAPGSYALSEKLEADQSLVVRQGGDAVVAWSIRVVPDLPPSVIFAAPVARTERFALAVPYLAEDDYGVTALALEIRPLRPPPSAAPQANIALPITLPGTRPRRAQETSYHDLTAHLWAGLPVSLTLVARDAVGQVARSKPVDAGLPERAFREPLARAIIEQRKALAADPAAMPRVAGVLDALTLRPDRFFEDRVLFLGLRSVYWRLRHAAAGRVPDDVFGTLWSLALRAEDGELSLAERSLRDAEQRMKQALDQDTKPQDFDALSRQLQRALDRFIDALAKQSQREAEQSGAPPQPDQGDRSAERQDLHDLIDRAGKLGQLGAKDAARELLSQLESIIQNLQAGRPSAQAQADQKRRGALGDLSRMMDRQQELLDRSFRESQGNPSRGDAQADRGMNRPDNEGGGGQNADSSPSAGGHLPGPLDGAGPGEGNGPSGARPSEQPGQGANAEPGEGGMTGGQGGGSVAEQERLRRQLGELMNRLGDEGGSIPGPLGRAERSMRDAREALGRGQPGDALDPQREALDQLQQGAEVLSRQMRESQGAGQLGSPGGSSGLSTDRDPLGRPGPTSGPDYGLGQDVPDGLQIERARRILQEIERRASERGRPSDELDYLDRLLRRF